MKLKIFSTRKFTTILSRGSREFTTLNRYLLQGFKSVNGRPRAFFFYASALWLATAIETTSSLGFQYIAQDFFWFPFQFLYLAVLVRLIPVELNNIFDIYMTIQALFLTIPILVIGFSNYYLPNSFNTLKLSTLFLISHLVLFAFSKIPNRTFRQNMNRARISINFIYYVLFITAISIIIFFAWESQFLVDFWTFDTLYENRNVLMKRLSESHISLVGYALGWISGVLIPIAYILGLSFRKRFWIFVMWLLAIVATIITYQKWLIGVMCFLTLMHFLWKSKRNLSSPSSDFFAFLLGLHCIIWPFISSLSAIDRISDLLIRRSLVDPAIVAMHYINYASTHSNLLWTDFNFNSRSDIKSASFLVGDFSAKGSNMTAGSIVDSLVQLESVGVIFASLTLGLFFLVINRLVIGHDIHLIFLISSLICIVLIETKLPTSLLSKGLLLIPIVLICMKPFEDKIRFASKVENSQKKSS
jgi:hypothetical protein